MQHLTNIYCFNVASMYQIYMNLSALYVSLTSIKRAGVIKKGKCVQDLHLAMFAFIIFLHFKIPLSSQKSFGYRLNFTELNGLSGKIKVRLLISGHFCKCLLKFFRDPLQLLLFSHQLVLQAIHL